MGPDGPLLPYDGHRSNDPLAAHRKFCGGTRTAPQTLLLRIAASQPTSIRTATVTRQLTYNCQHTKRGYCSELSQVVFPVDARVDRADHRNLARTALPGKRWR